MPAPTASKLRAGQMFPALPAPNIRGEPVFVPAADGDLSVLLSTVRLVLDVWAETLPSDGASLAGRRPSLPNNGAKAVRSLAAGRRRAAHAGGRHRRNADRTECVEALPVLTRSRPYGLVVF